MLDQNVSSFKQRFKLSAVGVVLEIERNGFFAAIEHGKGCALAVDQWRKTPRVLTARLFNLDHLGACLHEHQRCQWSRQQRAEIENQKTGQRLHEIT